MSAELWVIEELVGFSFEVCEFNGLEKEPKLAVYRNEKEARFHIDMFLEDQEEAIKSGDSLVGKDADDFRPTLIGDCKLSPELAEKFGETDALKVPKKFVVSDTLLAEGYLDDEVATSAIWEIEYESTTYREYRVEIQNMKQGWSYKEEAERKGDQALADDDTVSEDWKENAVISHVLCVRKEVK